MERLTYGETWNSRDKGAAEVPGYFNFVPLILQPLTYRSKDASL